ncbi:hypothetical protein [Enterococcus faecium]|uniref:hypothetical protein n=1 Tax=Enterococcus faecium TaxID=1352 RepID=UPI001F3AF1B9|nr:hypothetical protein [Enterococcus faecium]
MVKQQLDRIKEENNKPNLDDLLVAGKTYSIWDGSYVAVYQYNSNVALFLDYKMDHSLGSLDYQQEMLRK